MTSRTSTCRNCGQPISATLLGLYRGEDIIRWQHDRRTFGQTRWDATICLPYTVAQPVEQLTIEDGAA